MRERDLRPLGVGEIFDRAVHLFVQRFAVLTLILALVAIPVAIVQYAAQPSTAGMFADLQRLLSLPPGHLEEQRAILRHMGAHNTVGTAGAALIVISTILSALSTTACMIGVARAYAGKLPSVREVYRQALSRLLPQLVALVAFIALGIIVFFALTIVMVIVAFAIGALAAASRPIALIVGIPVAIVFALVIFGAVILLYFGAQMTLVSIALEDPNPVRGIAQGLRRTLNPALFWRSALVATIMFAVTLIGSFVLFALAAAISALTHLTALYPVVAVIGGVTLNALLTTFVVIYAVDVRVRREGYDLALDALQMSVGGGQP